MILRGNDCYESTIEIDKTMRRVDYEGLRAGSGYVKSKVELALLTSFCADLMKLRHHHNSRHFCVALARRTPARPFPPPVPKLLSLKFETFL